MSEPFHRHDHKDETAAYLPREVMGWKAEAEDELYDPETIFSYIDGAGEVYRSYNFRALLVRRLVKPDRPEIIVDFFDMGSSADAFGVFTHDLEGDAVGIGQGSTYKGGLLSFWKDRYFVSLYSDRETDEVKAAILETGKRIASAIPGEGPRPAMLDLLPREGVNPGDVRYFHTHLVLNYHFFVANENILNLDSGTDAVLASSGEREEKTYYLVILYPGAGRAAEAYRSFTGAYMPDAAKPGIVKTEDGRWTAARVKSGFVIVVFNAPTEASAVSFISQVEKNIKGL